MAEQPLPITKIESLFPVPLYSTSRESELSKSEKEEIEGIIDGELNDNVLNSRSKDSYIFNTKLQEIKEFCEGHINNYLEKVICPAKEKNINLYITQSWINLTRAGEGHHKHDHANSIISGVFYIQTLENDSIIFHDPNFTVKSFMYAVPEIYHEYNTDAYIFPVKNLNLVLFPSWVEHEVRADKQTTEDRISLSFNTFIEGVVGNIDELTEVKLN